MTTIAWTSSGCSNSMNTLAPTSDSPFEIRPDQQEVTMPAGKLANYPGFVQSWVLEDNLQALNFRAQAVFSPQLSSTWEQWGIALLGAPWLILRVVHCVLHTMLKAPYWGYLYYPFTKRKCTFWENWSSISHSSNAPYYVQASFCKLAWCPLQCLLVALPVTRWLRSGIWWLTHQN